LLTHEAFRFDMIIICEADPPRYGRMYFRLISLKAALARISYVP
jgi:hypothetical protein